MLKKKHVTYAHPHSLESKKATTFDRVVFLVSFLYPLSALLQAVDVFSGRTEGVSLLSWTIFLLCSTLFLIYGLKHRVPPMIVANSLWVVTDGLVITGLLLQAA